MKSIRNVLIYPKLLILQYFNEMYLEMVFIQIFIHVIIEHLLK